MDIEDALFEEDGIAVLGVIFELGSHNKDLQKILDVAEKLAFKGLVKILRKFENEFEEKGKIFSHFLVRGKRRDVLEEAFNFRNFCHKIPSWYLKKILTKMK